jgi:hypothetical protein
MRRNTIALTAAISIASTIPAFAHHGWGGNVDEVTAMTGTVTEGVKLAGPHGTMKIMTSDGKVWDITLAPAPHRLGRPEAGHHSRRCDGDSAWSAQSRSKPP